MNEEIYKFLSESFLFKDMTTDEIKSLTKAVDFRIEKYISKDVIVSPKMCRKSLGFILKGECIIERTKNNNDSLPLNMLKRGESFGILTVFSADEDFPTRVISKKETEILFFSKEDIHTFMKASYKVSVNIASFLAEKIQFLNNKIATFSSDSVREKLEKFLLSEYEKNNSETFKFNAKQTSAIINSGRASLYRAIQAMSDEGTIELSGRQITIKNIKQLERN